jgi:hypothetical protein
VAHEVDRGPWVEEIRTRDGLRIAVRMEPTRGRSTVVQFLPLDDSMTDPLSNIGGQSGTPLLDAARAVGQGEADGSVKTA